MTIKDFYQKVWDNNCQFLSPITPELEDEITEASDVIIKPGKIGEYLGEIKFIK